MDTLTGLREGVSEYLRSSAVFAGCEIRQEYPVGRREYPLEKSVIAVGIDSVETKGSFGGYLGVCEDGDQYGAHCLITMRFDIFTSSRRDGHSPHKLMEALWEALLLEENRFGFTAFHSDSVTWDKAVEANRLTARGTLRAALTRNDEALPLEMFRVSME